MSTAMSTAINTTRTLSRSQLRELKAELESERARLERSMALSSAPLGGASCRPGLPAAADPGDDTSLGVALLNRTQARHEAVVAALRRLEEGSYGVCAGCRQSIPYGRLLVMPEATHCVACGARA